MVIGEFGDRMPHFLVYVSRDFASLDVRQRNVHIRRCNRGCHGFKTVGDGHHDIGLEVVENGRKLEDSDTGGFCGISIPLKYRVKILYYQ